jgi:DNA (cytosine-5)-methyltransferase 1
VSEPTPEKRLIHVTAGNVRQSHVYINGHYDFFPKDIIGPSKRSKQGSEGIELILDGLGEAVQTDIGSDPKNGKPRGFLRGRAWVKRFYEHHDVKPGTVLSVERLAERRYRLAVERNGRCAGEGRLRAVEMFAGIGLVRLALAANEIDVVFANDIDPDKREMYEQNFNDGHFHLGDIHKLEAVDIPDCDLVTASFPCNDLSIAGAMNGLNSGQSSAFWGLIDLIKGMRDRKPGLILLENVPGFLMSNKGMDFEQALLALNKLGYAVDALFLDAAHFVPQSRLRLFVVARLDAKPTILVDSDPTPTRPKALLDFIANNGHIRWSLGPLPHPPERRIPLAQIIEKLPDDDPSWWPKARAEYFMAQLSERHLAVAEVMIRGKKISHGTAFRRVRNGRSMAELRVDGLAGCLRTPRGGSGRQILFQAGKGEYRVRLLSPRECARLQGVPESYVINVPLNQALFGFGDAVCVPALSWVVEQCISVAMVNDR